MISEVFGNLTMQRKFYGSEKYPVTHFPFHFIIGSDYCTARKLHERITEWLENIPEHGVANWIVCEALLFFKCDNIFFINTNKYS